ncbi:MAG: protein-L-isoaspartate O-methyltransferase [Patescibacteria group bacterium]|nr:protein-L-isoaspartate O-methyltransferase [Patescibacteria group bacterium]
MKSGLIDNLIKEGWLKTPAIIEAFQKIKRVDFLPENIKDLTEANEALPIGSGQTISQPLVVAFMLELLAPEPGEKILDIGAGSGWTSALLAHLVSEEGLKSKIKNQKSKINGGVIAIEIIPELKEFGERNVAKYNFIKKGIVEFILADGSRGYEKEAPFDKILCSAMVQGELPEAWKTQLKIGGRIVAPIGSSIWFFEKKSEKKFESKEYPGFAFVPLVTNNF